MKRDLRSALQGLWTHLTELSRREATHCFLHGLTYVENEEHLRSSLFAHFVRVAPELAAHSDDHGGPRLLCEFSLARWAPSRRHGDAKKPRCDIAILHPREYQPSVVIEVKRNTRDVASIMKQVARAERVHQQTGASFILHAGFVWDPRQEGANEFDPANLNVIRAAVARADPQAEWCWLGYLDCSKPGVPDEDADGMERGPFGPRIENSHGRPYRPRL